MRTGDGAHSLLHPKRKCSLIPLKSIKLNEPWVIAAVLDTELKTLKTAHKEVKAREGEEKDNEKLKKDVEKNKRKMQAESSSSSSKPKRARGK